jgi:hypothetical protein
MVKACRRTPGIPNSLPPWAMARTVVVRARCGLGLGASSDPELCAGIDGTPNYLARIMLIGLAVLMPAEIHGQRVIYCRLAGPCHVVAFDLSVLLKSTGRRRHTRSLTCRAKQLVSFLFWKRKGNNLLLQPLVNAHLMPSSRCF